MMKSEERTGTHERSGGRAPWEGGSGGLLEVVDMMCTVTETMAQIIRKQAEMIERTKMEEAVREELRAAREDADRQLDRIEYKLRRL